MQEENKPSSLNSLSKHPIVSRGPRNATPNLHHTQFMKAALDTFHRFNYQFQGLDWEIESGETLTDDGVMLFVNVWANKTLILPLSHEYKIQDKPWAVIEAWKEHFKRFRDLVNDRDKRVLERVTMMLRNMQLTQEKEAKKALAENKQKKIE